MLPDTSAGRAKVASGLLTLTAAIVVIPAAAPAAAAVPAAFHKAVSNPHGAPRDSIMDEERAILVYRHLAHPAPAPSPSPSLSLAHREHMAHMAHLAALAEHTVSAPASSPPSPSPASSQAPPPPPPPVVPQGSIEEYALRLVGADQFSCLLPLWNEESGWNPSAENPSTGAYGIPQALPGSKMESAGADWATNPYTQVRWGVEDYIDPVYGSPCGAWDHERADGWY